MVYTALDAQRRKNGCLTVIPYSPTERPIHTVRTEQDIEICPGFSELVFLPEYAPDFTPN